MNKKGFTLVELLAVIAILAILVLVAVPNVLGMFNNAKKDTFATETKDMIRIAQQQYLADFGKWNYYAIEVSKSDDPNAVDTKECTSTSGPEFKLETDGKTIKKDANGEPIVETYCKINKDAGNLKKFTISFVPSKGDVASIYSSDGTYEYTFSGGTFNAKDIDENVTEVSK